MPNHNSSQSSFGQKGVEQKGSDFFTRSRLRFTGCRQNAVPWSCRSSVLQRTANSVLTGCATQGVKPTQRTDKDRVYLQHV